MFPPHREHHVPARRDLLLPTAAQARNARGTKRAEPGAVPLRAEIRVYPATEYGYGRSRPVTCQAVA